MIANPDLGQQAILNADVLATKIGGKNACKFQANLKRAKERKARGQTQLILVSALRTDAFNTTDKLLGVVLGLQNGNIGQVRTILEEIRLFHEEIIDKEVEESAQSILKDVVSSYLSKFLRLISEMESCNGKSCLQNLGIDWIYTALDGSHHSLTGFGEDLCQGLYKAYFAHHELETNSIDKEDMTRKVYPGNPGAAFSDRTGTLERVRGVLGKTLGEVLEMSAGIQLDSGHLPFVAAKRGYTDAGTAEEARAADAHRKPTVIDEQKATKVRTGDGIPGSKGVELMSRGIAAEFTGVRGAAAKVLQSDVMSILKSTQVNIVIGDPDTPEDGTTYIPWNAGLEVDNLEIVASRETKTVLRVEGNMANRKGVLAAITALLKVHNIDQTISTRNTVTLTLDSTLSDEELEAIEADLRRKLNDNSFRIQKQAELGLVFCLGGSQREHPNSSTNGKVLISNRVAEPPFAATVMEDSTEGISIPYALTIEGPMSDSPGVLAVITEVLRDYNIDQTFSTETTWTVTLDEEVQAADINRLKDVLYEAFGNGWTFSSRTDLKIMARTENFSEHPLWNLLGENQINVSYMHALPTHGVTVMMVPKDQLSQAQIILHNHFHGTPASL